MSTRFLRFALLGVLLVSISGGFPFPGLPELHVTAPIRPFDRKDRDVVGDPIPTEALARLGTTRYRTISPATASSRRTVAPSRRFSSTVRLPKILRPSGTRATPCLTMSERAMSAAGRSLPNAIVSYSAGVDHEPTFVALSQYAAKRP